MAFNNAQIPRFKTRRQRLDIQWVGMRNVQSSWHSKWQDAGNYVRSNRLRLEPSEGGQGYRKDFEIADSTATRSIRTLEAGMMSGITSPARPWLDLITQDHDLMIHEPVKFWLDDFKQRMLSFFLQSNLYQILPHNYGDAATFGTACMLVEEHKENLIHCFSFPCGSYVLGADRFGRINVFMRRFQMTVLQLIDTFGEYDPKTGNAKWEIFSDQVRSLYEAGNYHEYIEVTHVIEPNEHHNPDRFMPQFKKWFSGYYESGTRGDGRYSGEVRDIFLRESGYDYFPVIAPRWEVVGEDVYGKDHPVDIAMGDIKQLQTMVRREAQAIEMGIRPPMVAHPDLRTASVGIVPGFTTWVAEDDGTKRFRNALDFRPEIVPISNKILQKQRDIQIDLFEDLFAMLRQRYDQEKTAYEVAELKEEKLSIIGPTVHQLDQDQNNPLIAIASRFMFKRQDVPPPPDELQGSQIQVRYISILHQAMKALGLGGLERTAAFVTSQAQIDESVLQVWNGGEAIRHHAENTGTPPKALRSPEEVEKRVAAANAAAAQQQELEAVKTAASAGKDLATTPVDDNSALNQMLDRAQAGSLV